MELFFRKAKESDADEITNISHRCMREVNSQGYMPEEIEADIRTLSKARVMRHIFEDSTYVAEANGKVIACGAVRLSPRDSYSPYLTLIFVNPDYHNQGIGRELIRVLEEDPLAFSVGVLKLRAARTATGFYLKLGYEYTEGPYDGAQRTIPMHKSKS